jgi:hypothetical protein
MFINNKRIHILESRLNTDENSYVVAYYDLHIYCRKTKHKLYKVNHFEIKSLIKIEYLIKQTVFCRMCLPRDLKYFKYFEYINLSNNELHGL